MQDDGEVTAQEPRLDLRHLREPVEVVSRGRIAIDRDQLPVSLQIGSEQRSVAARAEGGVDDRLPRLDGEQIPNLACEDWDVISRVWLQDVRQHPQHSLRLPPVPYARRHGPRSRDARSR